MKLLNLTSFQDTQAGLKIFPKKMSIIEKIKSNDFLFDIEFLHFAKQEKIEIVDFPIKYIYHDTSTSTNIIKQSFFILYKIFKIFLRLRKWLKLYLCDVLYKSGLIFSGKLIKSFENKYHIHKPINSSNKIIHLCFI